MTTEPQDSLDRLRSTLRYAIQGEYQHDNNCVFGGRGLVISVSGGMGYDDVVNTAEYLAQASPKNVAALFAQLDELREDYQATVLRANANGQMHKAAEADCTQLRAQVAQLQARLREAEAVPNDSPQ
jgi:chromosome segregation ATPase